MNRVFGPWNTGTNLMEKLLKTMYSGKQKVGSSEKHTLNSEIPENYLKKSKNNKIIFMYRPILSWLKSMGKESYTMDYKNIYSKQLKYMHCGKKYPMRKQYYDDIFEIYQKFYNMYSMLKDKYNEQVIIINYEKLISPEINRNNDYLKHKFPDAIFDDNKIKSVYNKPAKSHGKPVKNVAESHKKFEKDINSWSDKDKTYIFNKITMDLLFFDNQ